MWSRWDQHKRAEWKFSQLPHSSPVYNQVVSAMWKSEVDGFSKRRGKICFSEGFWHRLDEEGKDVVTTLVLSSFLEMKYLEQTWSEWMCVCVCAGHTGWAWQTLATSSQEAPYSMARAASLIISPAPWRRRDKCSSSHSYSTTDMLKSLPAHVCHVRVRSPYRSNDVSSQHPVCLLVAEDLHHAISVRICFGSTVGCKRELSNSVGNSLKTVTWPKSGNGKTGFRILPFSPRLFRTLTKPQIN